MMESNLVDGNNGKSEDKQNVSVIFVPENILLALSKSTEDSSAVIWTPEGNIAGNQENRSTISTDASNEDDCLKRLLASSQQQSLVVLDSGEWIVDSNQSQSQSGIAVQPNIDATILPTKISTATSSSSTESTSSDTNNVVVEIHKDLSKNRVKRQDNKEPTDDNVKVGDGVKFRCRASNCTECFTTLEKLLAHKKTHRSHKPHCCSFEGCTWSFSTPYKLRRHEESHKQSKLFKCSYPGCNVSCSTKYNLKVHAKFHEDEGFHRCEHCSKCFRNRMKLVKHTRTEHEAKPVYKCPFPGCDKRFYTIPAQKIHEKWHRKQKFVCGVEGCGKEFTSIPGFQLHYRTVHFGDRPFKCDYPGCKWEFSTNSNLKRHAMTHTNVKNYCCPIPGCLSRFYRKEHLRSHLRVHKPGNESRKQDMPIHVSDLEGWEYYFCPYDDCGSLFSTLAGAKLHILKTHAAQASDLEQKERNPSDKEADQHLIVYDIKKSGSNVSFEKVVSEETEAVPSEAHSNTNNGADASTQSILQALMEAEPNTELAANETINTTSLQTTLSPTSGNLTFISTNSQPIQVAMLPEPQPTQSSLSLTTSSIDPSQFLLDSSAVFTAASSSDSQDPDPDAAKFFSLRQSSTSSSPNATQDGFLSYDDCVQTVDPNVIMSLRSTAASCHAVTSSLSSMFGMSDDDNTSEKDYTSSSGSARTNYIPYQRRKKICSPITIQEGRSGEVHVRSFIGFEPDANSFNFREKASGSFCSIGDKNFVESTINLRDLA